MSHGAKVSMALLLALQLTTNRELASPNGNHFYSSLFPYFTSTEIFKTQKPKTK